MDDVTSKKWNRQDITERLVTKIHDVISTQDNALVKRMTSYLFKSIYIWKQCEGHSSSLWITEQKGKSEIRA